MTTYSACTCHKRPSLDEKYPPNETPAALALWNLATTPDETIPGGTLFVEKWSNGHYGPPETTGTELLPTDNIGPDFTCERRVLVPAQENPRPLTPDAITDEMVERALMVNADLRPETVRRMLTAALTEPPARPEGAEDIEVLLFEAGVDENRAEVANFLAARLTDPTRKEA